jgi:diaminopimelate epimerase
MAGDLYDARGNIYLVATPREVFGATAPAAQDAALTAGVWTKASVERLCRGRDREGDARTGMNKSFGSDGLLVGPFPAPDAHEIVIVNTDGSLAERSGNGLTIFAQFLADNGYLSGADRFLLRVHHANPRKPPTEARIEPATFDGKAGFWIDMGAPAFGPEAVEALSHAYFPARFRGREVSTVRPLAALDRGWTHSVFVSVGNPHCVTLLTTPPPAPAELGSAALRTALTKIANAPISAALPTSVCRHGVNLQWAQSPDSQAIAASVFERGEGPTMSSGSSAVAVASACHFIGSTGLGMVRVRMAGGELPVRLERRPALQASLFGVAARVAAG